ncbi:MAG TPA: type II secretion system protein N [Rudaea sp.]|nr:type II secretion system protein N [Rudaea sp.]
MKFLRRLILVLLALLVVAVVVAATCPAEYAYRLVADRLGALKLLGVSGSIWQGHATSAQVFGQDVGALDWRVDVAPLFVGEVTAHLALRGGEVTANGVVDRMRDGSIVVRDTDFAFPARLLAPALDIPALELLGRVEGKLGEARIRGFWADQARGEVVWRNAACSGAAQAVFGDLEATFSSTPEGAIAGVVRDLGGPLALAGTFKATMGGYDAEATLSARDGNPQVADALRFVGAPQADGSSHLIIHGNLFKLF